MNNLSELIDFEQFSKVEILVGTVISAIQNENARKAAYVLDIDFGEELGIKRSSAQITENYLTDDLIGTQVIAVTNFPPKRVAGIKSEVLVLAAVDEEKGNILLRPDSKVANGTRIL